MCISIPCGDSYVVALKSIAAMAVSIAYCVSMAKAMELA